METERIKLKEIKPALTGYISKSRVLLKRDAVIDDDAVHDIRVLMKKSRAALKLLTPGIENDLHEKDIQSLKRVGKIMSEWRDTSVHRITLKELKKVLPRQFEKLKDNEKIAVLIKKQDVDTEPAETLKLDIDEIEALLNKTGYRIRFYQVQKIGPAALINMLESSYENVRKVYLECRNRTKPEKVHEFRKRSKDLLYQLYFFRPLNPAAVKSFEKRLERLTLNLGKYNDLYQLLKALAYVFPDETGSPAMDELAIKIYERQDRYLSKVWADAYKCLCPGINLADLLELRLIIIK
jgi:CHAD domain-containing protein